MHIRDPIHGVIEVTPDERALIDSPQYQRLRNVKQLGFADMAFPGATHTRYAHGLGAMQVATRVFDALANQLELDLDDRDRYRQTLRLAVLFHDLGHAPLSHATERIMPPAKALKLPAWARAVPHTIDISENTSNILSNTSDIDGNTTSGSRIADSDDTRQANHEDYTLKLLLDSGLTAEIERRMGPRGISPLHIAALVAGRAPPGPAPFRNRGRDLLPILRQIVSGELDADRMDYLQRDSFFTGVNYGKFDSDWIIENLSAVERSGEVHLALLPRAVFAFEDFLLSRYHMFMSVYFHYASVGYEQLLQRYCDTSSGEYSLPADIDEYLQHDDIALISALRKSDNPWAKRIVRRQGFKMLLEEGPFEAAHRADASHVAEMAERLEAEGIDCFKTTSRGILSTYGRAATLWVKSPHGDIPIADYTPLYRRYVEPSTLARLYVVPERAEEAKALLDL